MRVGIELYGKTPLPVTLAIIFFSFGEDMRTSSARGNDKKNNTDSDQGAAKTGHETCREGISPLSRSSMFQAQRACIRL